MRRRGGKGAIVPRAEEFLARNYELLRSRLPPHGRIVGFFDPEDLFHETSLLVLHDPRVALLQTDEEFREFFRCRYRMVAFQTRRDAEVLIKKLKKYADNQQTAEEDDLPAGERI